VVVVLGGWVVVGAGGGEGAVAAGGGWVGVGADAGGAVGATVAPTPIVGTGPAIPSGAARSVVHAASDNSAPSDSVATVGSRSAVACGRGLGSVGATHVLMVSSVQRRRPGRQGVSGRLVVGAGTPGGHHMAPWSCGWLSRQDGGDLGRDSSCPDVSARPRVVMTIRGR
jgi:hypothetical protein